MDQNHRRFLRKVPDDLAFIQIERDEVGKVLNVSEGGLRFSSVSPVPRNLPVYFWFSFNLKDRIEGMGEVTWTDLSRTVGGLRFTQLSQAAREQIRRYLSRMRPEPDEVPYEEPVSQLVLAGKLGSNGKHEVDRVARFAAKARAYRPTFYRKGQAPGIPKAAPALSQGVEPRKARADRPVFSLEVADRGVSRVAPPAIKPEIKKMDAPKAPLMRSILSPEGLDRADLPKSAQPPAIKIDPPKPPVDRLTLSLEEVAPAGVHGAPRPTPGIEQAKARTDNPAFSIEALDPTERPIVAQPSTLGIEPPKAAADHSKFSVGEASPADLRVASHPVSEIEPPKAPTERSVFSLEVGDPGVSGAAPLVVPETELPKASTDSSLSSLSSLEGANPAGLRVVPPPAPEAELPMAPALRPALALEETNLADSKVALPPALGIEAPKAGTDRPIISLGGTAAKESKASSRSLRGIESFVTGLVPLQRHLMAKKRQLLRGMILGMCISTAVTVPTVNYWNRAHAENIKPSPAPTTSLNVKNNNNDVPTTPPAQPAVTKPSAPLGNIFSGSPAPDKWTSPNLTAKKQLAIPYRPETLKEVLAKIPKPVVTSTPATGKTAGKKSSMTPTQLWGAVQAGSSTAAVELAELYIKGDGVPQSCQQARVLLLVASEKRNTAAIKRLHDLDKSPACP